MKGCIGAVVTALLSVASALPAASVDSSSNSSSSINQTTYPQYLTGGTSQNLGPPWGFDTVSNANPYTQQPAGQLRTYEFNITRGTVSPDGTGRSVILINGQFPGPPIQANWGDTIQVTVHNNIQDVGEGTAIHWHGILQTGTPWEDGTPGVAGCPIAPGATHVYSFLADLYGTTFYHSHYSAQLAGALFGPLIVYGPTSKSYGIDLGPVLLSDWGHATYEQQVEEAVGVGSGLVFTQSSLINGKTDQKYAFKTGNTYRLRLVNAAAEAPYTFSIDEHSFEVIAHDFVPVNPYMTKNITLGAGQRADILVNATGKADGSYWIRSAPSDCSLLENKAPAKAAIYYQNANTNSSPTSSAQNYDTGCTYSEITSFGTPAYSLSPPSNPSTTVVMNITNWTNHTGNPVWGINKSVFHADYNEPPLLLAHAKQLSPTNSNYQSNWNVYNMGSNKSVRLEVYNYNTQSSHPMHLHGHNFWIVAEGHGIWNGKVQTGSNPPRRDTFMLNTATDASTPGYTVIEYNQDNPGVWPFHCHIAWHVSAGLYANMVERPNDIVSLNIPSKMTNDCQSWSAWEAAGNVPFQIDSGLKMRANAKRQSRLLH